ncbi:MAG: hypothetical protein Q8Q09_08990 [Deltaproteobacteria bacterium]|nr:hypothetical protein [Deltaproteobacteria bacterium]
MLTALRTLFSLAARDIVALAGGREDFSDHLEAFAKRRQTLYGEPSSPLWAELYWPGIAQALSSEAPLQWMPMEAVIELGITLEGGAKGLRGLFTKEPSDKEQKRVLKTATLAGRILEMIVNSDRALWPEESRLVAMAMNSFGLSAEALTGVQPGRALTFEDLEIFGDLDLKTRRALLRGTWQIAIARPLTPERDLAVRGVAARLELPHEADGIRSEVMAVQQRRLETAKASIELARSVARLFSPSQARASLQHLVASIAPSAHRGELEAHALSSTPVQLGAVPKLDSARKRQAIAAAYASLLAHDPALSHRYLLRVRITDDGILAGLGSETAHALDSVERYLAERVRELSPSLQPVETAVVQVESAGEITEGTSENTGASEVFVAEIDS